METERGQARKWEEEVKTEQRRGIGDASERKRKEEKNRKGCVIEEDSRIEKEN